LSERRLKTFYEAGLRNVSEGFMIFHHRAVPRV
jgi:hypothetical protein